MCVFACNADDDCTFLGAGWLCRDDGAAWRARNGEGMSRRRVIARRDRARGGARRVGRRRYRLRPRPIQPRRRRRRRLPRRRSRRRPQSSTRPSRSTTDEIGDQAIGAEIGVATGGRVTPGGLRITGHYLYQLSDQDWFDGTAAFTFGGGAAACFRDRTDAFVCDHGLADGDGIELAANVRRMFAAQGHVPPVRARRRRPRPRALRRRRRHRARDPAARAAAACARRSRRRSRSSRRPSSRSASASFNHGARRRAAARRSRSSRAPSSGCDEMAIALLAVARRRAGTATRAPPQLPERPTPRRRCASPTAARRSPRACCCSTTGGQPLHIGTLDLYGKRQGATACAIAPGVSASWDGMIARVRHRRGPGRRRHVRAVAGDPVRPLQGVGVARHRVRALGGRGRSVRGPRHVELAIPLERAWTPHGTLAADLHVHAHASNDSLMPNPQRVIAQVAAGIQVIGLSDHNANGDLDAEIHELTSTA